MTQTRKLNLEIVGKNVFKPSEQDLENISILFNTTPDENISNIGVIVVRPDVRLKVIEIKTTVETLSIKAEIL